MASFSLPVDELDHRHKYPAEQGGFEQGHESELQRQDENENYHANFAFVFVLSEKPI